MATLEQLWRRDYPVSQRDVEVPRWIEPTITCADVAAICQGGCDSGAYMPAVTYHMAADTMRDHGDDVLQYLEDGFGELPKHHNDISWSAIACFYLSCAVELWAAGTLEAMEFDEPDE